MKIQKAFIGIGLFIISLNSFASYTETTLSCRVETELRNGTITINKKAEFITLDLKQHNEWFMVSGDGEMASIIATNDSRFPGASNFDDRTSAGKYEVDYSKKLWDEKTQKNYIDEVKFRLDRVSGELFYSRTWKSVNPKANIITSGTCQRANKKF
jgi:hypothetical protein